MCLLFIFELNLNNLIMKNNFIELTQANESKIKILINLQNVCEILKFEGADYTTICYNNTRNGMIYMTNVKETYEEIKTLIQAQ